MGEENVQLIEQNVQHNTEDIRELKKKVERVENDVSELKSNHKLTQQSITHIMTGLDELKAGFKEIDDKMDKNQEKQFQSYKTFMWKVGATITGSIIVALIVFALNIK
ncbi:hypothetical protein [Halobacillus karajensis]|uniref:Uncharacterized protein n=1 Tax=Halobacillus karajensis TaxID=195088 RepID=A0A059NYK4_9BACI|nr:hypothetical protein [Halobacillus karajensis]CDQ22562.1 hypothetical protein BN983_00775 [Halobacillus karajensis]CDQ26044.1 hypothetical protein BN981_00255 [Halobacillus karajensis]